MTSPLRPLATHPLSGSLYWYTPGWFTHLWDNIFANHSADRPLRPTESLAASQLQHAPANISPTTQTRVVPLLGTPPPTNLASTNRLGPRQPLPNVPGPNLTDTDTEDTQTPLASTSTFICCKRSCPAPYPHHVPICHT